MALLLAVVASALAAIGCGDDEAPATPGRAGTSGKGGVAGSGGGSGSDAGGGKQGNGGSSGTTGGSGGVAGGGGTAGGVSPDGGPGGSEAGDAGIGPFARYPMVVPPAENAFSEAKAVLGKILFWEEQMGGDNTMACGTCHRGSAGGSDPRSAQPTSRHPGPDGQFNTNDDVHGSMGVKRCQISGTTVTYKSDTVFGTNVQVTKRKAPTYLDAMFAADIFWDGRATTKFTVPDTGEIAIQFSGALESQAVGPPNSPVEMSCEGRTWADIHEKLRTSPPLQFAENIPNDMREALAANPTYPALFTAAFGSPEINTKRIAFAIATHERRLTSDQTPWDRFNAGETSALTPAQQHGFVLFMTKAKCNGCHAPPLFTDGVFHNLGFIDVVFDEGRKAISGQALDLGRVKTATIRNVGLRERGGLLHYGFGPGANLDEVMKAYNEPPNRANTDSLIVPLGLTPEEIRDINDFMRTGLTDPRVRDELPPFDRPKLGSEP